MLTIVRQEPDGKLELLQQHNKEELARLQHTPSRNNSIRRSTIHVPEQSQPLYCPSHRRLSITPSIPSITPSMNSIFKFRRYGILVIPLYDSTNIKILFLYCLLLKLTKSLFIYIYRRYSYREDQISLVDQVKRLMNHKSIGSSSLDILTPYENTFKDSSKKRQSLSSDISSPKCPIKNFLNKVNSENNSFIAHKFNNILVI